MKRTLTGLAAASVILGTAIPVSFAASTSSQWFTMSIQINGSTLSKPYGIAESDGSTTTTYIPLYYVNQALSKIGYQSSWNGSKHTWSLTSSQKGLDFSSMVVGTGNTSIMVNGTLVKQMNSIVNLDPSGGTSTTYVPIYYVSPIIQALGISAVWNGTTHTWSIGNNSGNGSSSSTNSSSTSSSGGSSSSNSSTSGISSSGTTLSSPSLQVSAQSSDTTNINVTNAKSGATVTLYDANGNSVVATTAQSNGTATFYNVSPGSYYSMETLGGQKSGQSNTVTITKNTSSSSPTIYSNHSNGIWYIGVNDVAPSAQVTLYSTNGSKMAATNANQYGYATFNNVPTGSYYVIEQANGQNVQSNAITVNTSSNTSGNTSSGTENGLSTPSIVTNSTNGTLTVNNVQSGATVTLYSANGSAYETATANPSGYATFTNVNNGTYYAVQAVNGQQSGQSSTVDFQTTSSASASPNVSVNQNSNGTASLYITNVTAGDTVTLYNSNGTVYGTLTASSSGSATFDNVQNGTYYAVQTSNGQQSPASNYVTVSSTNLTAPNISVSQGNGTGSLYISNLIAGATVSVYNSNGTLYGSVTASSSGTATFNNVGTATYYAVQKWNGQESPKSSYVSVTDSNLNAPSISLSQNNGVGTVYVSNVSSGSTVTLYQANGSSYAHVTANSSGSATFSNVASGSYYAVQSQNGSQSSQSQQVTIASNSNTPNAPHAYLSQTNSNGTYTITVNGAISNATITLYTSRGSEQGTSSANSSGYATFSNVPSGDYYAIQTSNGYQSPRSDMVTLGSTSNSLATPNVSVSTSNGTGTVVVSNLASNATVSIYRTNGTKYASGTTNNGYLTFTNVPGGTYYVVQELNGNQSNRSNDFSI